MSEVQGFVRLRRLSFFSVVSCFLSRCLFVQYVFAGFGWGTGGGAVAVTLFPTLPTEITTPTYSPGQTH